MKNRLSVSFVILTFLFSVSGEAAVLFSDNFQDPAASKTQWSFPDSIASTYANGKVTLRNKDTKYMWFVIHTMASKKANFTLSATITLSTSSNGVGLTCCATDSTGILVHLGDVQNVYVKKFTPSAQPELLDVVNSFISRTTNVLTISKKESVFNFFCNNTSIGSVTETDPMFAPGGDIGIVLPPQTSATFDDVVMTDDFKPATTRTCFSDDFIDTDILGWYTYTINGTYQSGGGKFSVVNSDAQLSGLLYVNGDFKRSSIKVITSYQSGKGPYGCMFVYTTPTDKGNTYKTFSFLVDSTQRYGVSMPESSSIKMSLPKTFIHGSTAGGKDTLEVLKFNDKIEFIINNTVVENALPVPSQIPDAVGLYIGPQTSVSFEKFAVGGDSTGASCPVIAFSGNQVKRFTPILNLPVEGLAIDALGRMSKRFGDGYYQAMRNSASGLYFLRQPAGGNHMSVKMRRSLR